MSVIFQLELIAKNYSLVSFGVVYAYSNIQKCVKYNAAIIAENES